MNIYNNYATKWNKKKNIIYKIVCNDLNVKEIYVGHTTNLYTRKATHKSFCNNLENPHIQIKIYQVIRNNGGWENW